MIHALHQSVHREGLVNVVSDAKQFSILLVPLAFVSSDHDDRHRNLAVLAQSFKNQKATSLWHHHVQDEQIGVLGFGVGDALVSVASNRDSEAFRLQGVFNGVDNLWIIVNDQNVLFRLKVGFVR